MKIRELQSNEWDRLAHLIFHSTNAWYQKNLNRRCFAGNDPAICRIFPEVYEALDPGCCLVADIGGTIAGACFYHPRETHVSLGIMNADPEFAGRGVARELLQKVIARAEGKPVRLVSSALNLDSYSLYNRAGFRPQSIFQDMFLPEGKPLPATSPKVRPAKMADVRAIVNLEEQVSGIRREKDWSFFLQDRDHQWRGMVFENLGEITGVLFSIDHPGSCMLGPGVMHDEEAAFQLIVAQLSTLAPRTPVFLVPAKAQRLTHRLYQLGARNCEIHLGQVLGKAQEIQGIVMPSFMPETG